MFPRGGDLPRHPSQLYEAAAEGLLLLILMYLLSRQPKIRERHGFLSGSFLVLYGLMRFGIEFFREPDPQLGFLFGNNATGVMTGITMGQVLCLPMILAGLVIIVWSVRKKSHERA